MYSTVAGSFGAPGNMSNVVQSIEFSEQQSGDLIKSSKLIVKTESQLVTHKLLTINGHPVILSPQIAS